MAVAKGSGYDAHAAESGSVRARSCRVSWLWKCLERPAGARRQWTQGLVQMAGGAANVGGGSGHGRRHGRRSEQPGLARGSEWAGGCW